MDDEVFQICISSFWPFFTFISSTLQAGTFIIPHWPFGYPLCMILFFIKDWSFAMSVLTLTLIAVERYRFYHLSLYILFFLIKWIDNKIVY